MFDGQIIAGEYPFGSQPPTELMGWLGPEEEQRVYGSARRAGPDNLLSGCIASGRQRRASRSPCLETGRGVLWGPTDAHSSPGDGRLHLCGGESGKTIPTDRPDRGGASGTDTTGRCSPRSPTTPHGKRSSKDVFTVPGPPGLLWRRRSTAMERCLKTTTGVPPYSGRIADLWGNGRRRGRSGSSPWRSITRSVKSFA